MSVEIKFTDNLKFQYSFLPLPQKKKRLTHKFVFSISVRVWKALTWPHRGFVRKDDVIFSLFLQEVAVANQNSAMTRRSEKEERSRSPTTSKWTIRPRTPTAQVTTAIRDRPPPTPVPMATKTSQRPLEVSTKTFHQSNRKSLDSPSVWPWETQATSLWMSCDPVVTMTYNQTRNVLSTEAAMNGKRFKAHSVTVRTLDLWRSWSDKN